MIRRLLVLTAALLAVAGCGQGSAAGSAAQQPADPGAVVGWWRVAGTEQRAIIDPTGIEIVEDDATHTGTWRADPEGRFAATIDTTIPAADGTAPAAPDWVARAGAYSLTDDGVVLHDRTGAELVTLEADERFPGTGLVDPAIALDAPNPAGEPAAAVPAGLEPADAAGIAGRWDVEGATAPAFVDFAPDGAWSGSDGCNGAGGAWTLGADGGFVATAPSIMTLIACEGGADVATPLGTARRAALEGDALVLLDAAASPLLRLVRA